MYTKRIIPCLDVKNGRVVKGINFVGLKDVGDPVELAKMYYEQGADEIVFLDISATQEERKTMIEVAKRVAEEIFIPFTIGGGIASIEDITRLLRSGADKISLNSAAIKNPNLIKEGANRFGSQCITVAIDAKLRADKSGWNVFIAGGKIDTGKDLLAWVKEVVSLGAGEILLTSMDADGTKKGFDLAMLSAVNALVNVPVIASGGCGSKEDILAVLDKNYADAALAASIFHYGEYRIKDVKQYLKANNIPIRW